MKRSWINEIAVLVVEAVSFQRGKYHYKIREEEEKNQGKSASYVGELVARREALGWRSSVRAPRREQSSGI